MTMMILFDQIIQEKKNFLPLNISYKYSNTKITQFSFTSFHKCTIAPSDLKQSEQSLPFMFALNKNEFKQFNALLFSSRRESLKDQEKRKKVTDMTDWISISIL